MCDDRERLIGYVYDEYDPGERRAIEQHLNECPDCRHEIRGLRQTREDLLAWDVPAHEPIWRPAVEPAPRVAWWQMPAWGMAAAAAVLLTVGAAGGVATHALFFREAPAVARSANVPPVIAGTREVGATPAELAALEARVLATLRRELAERTQVVSSPPQNASNRTPGKSVEDLEKEIAALRADQVGLAAAFLDDVRGISARQRAADDRWMLTSLSQGGMTPSVQGR